VAQRAAVLSSQPTRCARVLLPYSGMYTPQQVAAALDLTLSRTMRDTLLAAATQQPPQPAAPAAAKGHRRSKGSKAQAGAATEPAEGPSGAPGVRLDGRALPEVRPLTALAGPLPRRVHGSALFSRGDTQSLASVTVGSPREGLGVSSGYAALAKLVGVSSCLDYYCKQVAVSWCLILVVSRCSGCSASAIS
jgi:hypothetical protein